MIKRFALQSGLLCAGCLQLAAQVGAVPPRQDPGRSPCSLVDPRSLQAAAVDDDALLAAYNRQADAIHSMHIEALLRARAGQEYRVGEKQREFPILLDLVRPDLVRVTGAVPAMSSRGFEMASDGKEFRLLISEDGRREFLAGPADAPPQSQNPRENLRPQPIVDALLWRSGKLLQSSESGVQKAGTRTIRADLQATRAGEQTAQIGFNLQRGTVDSLTILDAAGGLVSEVKYADWAKIDSFGAEPVSGCFPRKVDFLEPSQDYEISLQILRVAYNQPIPRSAFHPSPPKGVPVIPLLSAPAK